MQMPSHMGKMALMAALWSSLASSHTWVEQLMVINQKGAFTGSPGYCRNNTLRSSANFGDPIMVHILPTDGQPAIEQRDIGTVDTANIKPADSMCKRTQQQQFQTQGSPRLSASAGNMIALRYQENGHVTLSEKQVGKPPNRGTVYIYGTTQPKSDEKFLDVFGKWNAAGTGGDKRGRLLATQNFDDGQCYQINSGELSETRRKQFSHEANQLMGADLWCQNDIQLPSDAPSGKPYTLYWVWDWPTEPGADPAIPSGKAEVYTTCMDIDIKVSSQQRGLDERDSASINLNNLAIPSYVSQMMALAAPAATSAQASPASVAVAATTPPPQIVSQPSQGLDTTFIAEAFSVIEQAVESELASQIEASLVPGTVTITHTVQPIQPTSAPLKNSETAQPLTPTTTLTTTITSYSTTVTVHPSSNTVVAGMPPTSLDIKAPEGIFQGTATPANAPQSSASPAIAPRACGKCKVKRSRILQ